MKIEKLKSDDTKEFKYLMQAAFQYGYESIFGKSDSEILPEKDIDRDLKKPNSHAYAMMDQNPYFDKRNIHFYVNKLKFKIVRYF